MQLAVAGDAGVRATLSDSVERGVMAWGVANNPEAHQGWKVGLEAEMGFPVSEAYSLPVNAKSLLGSVMANLCGSH